MQASIADRYCERNRIPESRFIATMLRQCLYPHSLPLLVLRPRMFERDRDFIDAVGRCSELEELESTVRSMPWYYSERWAFRQRFRLRVSGRKVMVVAKQLLAAAERTRI